MMVPMIRYTTISIDPLQAICKKPFDSKTLVLIQHYYPPYLAHVLEVEDVDGNTKNSIQHGSYLAILSTGNNVSIPTGKYCILEIDLRRI
jgi:hypothetical protein